MMILTLIYFTLTHFSKTEPFYFNFLAHKKKHLNDSNWHISMCSLIMSLKLNQNMKEGKCYCFKKSTIIISYVGGQQNGDFTHEQNNFESCKCTDAKD